MLVIRLMRTGKIHAPHYRIVVQEKRSKLNGSAIDTIGHYHPASAEKLLVIDKEKAQDWLKKGAQPSDTVTNLFVKDGILDKSRTVRTFFTPKKKEEVEEKTAIEETPKTTEESAPKATATESNESAPAEAQDTEEASTTEESAPETESAA